MGRSAWGWKSKVERKKGLQAPRFRVAASELKNSLDPWNLRLNWNPKAQLESSGESARTSVLPVAAARTHLSHPRVLPRDGHVAPARWSSVTHTRATQEQVSTSAHSSPAPCAASSLVEELLRRDFLSFRKLNTT